MKKRLLPLFIAGLLITSVGSASSRETGGIPSAPQAVVIQSYANRNGEFDLGARSKVLALAAQHIAEDRVVVFAQRRDLQDAKRTYICIEYRSFDAFTAASEEFKKELKDHSTTEVVTNGGCH